jgi:acyl carrier protein
LLGLLRQKISSYKVPTQIFPIAEIPKNKMGKVIREALAKRFSDRRRVEVPVNDSAISSRICRIVADLFALNLSEVTPTFSRDQAPQWDSLGHVQILAAVEQSFGVRLSEEGALAARSISDLSGLVEYALHTK